MAALRNLYTQLYPPAPTFTEAHLPSLHGKIYIVTGANAGIGFELVKILYAKGAKIYMANRSRSKTEAAIESIRETAEGDMKGEIAFLELDLGDLTSVKNAARSFATQETKLDVLWNNAGATIMPVDSKTKQGYQLVIGTNCLGPFLFTQLLLPQLRTAANSAPKASVRVIWTSSIAVDGGAPKGGMELSSITSPPLPEAQDPGINYTNSKTGNWFLASELAKRVGTDGIVSLTQNPGNLSTGSWDNASNMVKTIFSLINKSPKLGAYTELWAGLSENITLADGGRYVIPWGRWHLKARSDILDALKTKEEGGTGVAAEFWKWCEEQTKSYV